MKKEKRKSSQLDKLTQNMMHFAAESSPSQPARWRVILFFLLRESSRMKASVTDDRSLTTNILKELLTKVDFETTSERMCVPGCSEPSLVFLTFTLTWSSPFQERQGLLPAFGFQKLLHNSLDILGGVSRNKQGPQFGAKWCLSHVVRRTETQTLASITLAGQVHGQGAEARLLCLRASPPARALTASHRPVLETTVLSRERPPLGQAHVFLL